MEDITKHYLISGRVQGVGYRRFVQRQAIQLQLRGWVRNLRDGRVEAIAEGPVDRLTELEKRLREGPSMSQVDSLQITAGVPAAKLTEFSVREDGEEPCGNG